MEEEEEEEEAAKLVAGVNCYLGEGEGRKRGAGVVPGRRRSAVALCCVALCDGCLFKMSACA